MFDINAFYAICMQAYLVIKWHLSDKIDFLTITVIFTMHCCRNIYIIVTFTVGTFTAQLQLL